MTPRNALAPVAALLACSFLLASAANAAYDPIGSGFARLSLAKPFAHLLASHRVKLSATAPAKRRGHSFSLSVSGGAIDPLAEKGEIETEGGLSFERGTGRVPLRHIVVRTKHEPLIAKVGGGQLKLARAARLSFARTGFGSTFAATDLRLSAKLATRLGKKLHLHGVFEAGQLIGTLRSEAQPSTVAVLPTGGAGLTPDPAFLAKLDSLFVSLNPIAPAERAPGPLFTLPIIAGGALAPIAIAEGTLRTGGSLEFLQLGAGQIFLHELWFEPAAAQVLAEVDIEPTPTFPGKLGQIPVAGLGPGAPNSDPSARTISLSGAPLVLNAQMAAAFNQAFAKPQGRSDIFQPGEPLGTLTFTAQTQ